MKILLLSLLALTTFAGQALANQSADDAALVNLVKSIKEEKNLDARLKAQVAVSLAESMGEFFLNDFSVHWDSLRCLAVEGFDGEPNKGSCVVEAGAFQVVADLAIIVESSGDIKIATIEAEVE